MPCKPRLKLLRHTPPIEFKGRNKHIACANDVLEGSPAFWTRPWRRLLATPRVARLARVWRGVLAPVRSRRH